MEKASYIFNLSPRKRIYKKKREKTFEEIKAENLSEQMKSREEARNAKGCK